MIVNADDLGAGPQADAAIARALEEGLVSSASLLAVTPGFDQGAEIARLYPGRIGVHLSLTEGDPLTEAIRGCRRFCDPDGRFFEWRGAARAFWLSRSERDAVAGELRAQIERCRSAGIEVAHLDSHHHVHTEPAIGPIVIAIARASGITRVRLGRNCGGGRGALNRIYKTLFNARLRAAALAGTRWFGGIEDYEWARARRARGLDDFELMTHPVLDDSGRLVDAETLARPLEELLAVIRAG